MISERISDDIPPQMKILNMIIPIFMHFCSFERCKSHKAVRHPTKCDVIIEVKLFRKEQICDVTQSDVEFQKQVH